MKEEERLKPIAGCFSQRLQRLTISGFAGPLVYPILVGKAKLPKSLESLWQTAKDLKAVAPSEKMFQISINLYNPEVVFDSSSLSKFD